MRPYTFFWIVAILAIVVAGCTTLTSEPNQTEGDTPAIAPSAVSTGPESSDPVSSDPVSTDTATDSPEQSATQSPEPLAMEKESEPTTVPSVDPTDIPPQPVEIPEPVRLTTNPGEDLDPAWDPRGGTIAYMTTKPGAEGRPYDIGAVVLDGNSQGVLASGPNQGIGIAGELSWIGETGLLMTNKRMSIHEYMTFDTAQAPFERTAANGDDSAFTKNLVIPGGMGGDGLAVSRDGQTVMWMIRTSHDPSSYVVTVRIADVAELSGQPANNFGRVVPTHSAAYDGPDFNRGFSMAPDASFFVVSLKSGDGYDLSLRDLSTEEEIMRLTTTGASDGVMNMYPDVSADGKMVAFSAQASAESNADLLVIGIDGTGGTKITDALESSETRPSWSPDGTQLVYQGKDDTDDHPGWDIYLLDVTSGVVGDASAEPHGEGSDTEIGS